MSAPPQADGDRDFPLHGSRARALARFERDLHAWLDTPEGRFAVWQAREPCWTQARRMRQDASVTPSGGTAAHRRDG
jgi:hypothetical protein